MASPMMKRLRLALFCFALPLCAATVQAGSITTPDLNGIYGQASFSTPIRIDWLAPGATIVSPALASVDSEADFFFLDARVTDAQPVVTAFFVDSINWCNESGGGFLGCAYQPGSTLVVNSSAAAGAQGALILGHELAHNLGLPHDNSSGNLMFAAVGASFLTVNQANAVLASPLLRIAQDGSRFIQIRPVAVVSAVPEPETYLLIIAGVLVVLTARRWAAR